MKTTMYISSTWYIQETAKNNYIDKWVRKVMTINFDDEAWEEYKQTKAWSTERRDMLEEKTLQAVANIINNKNKWKKEY
jgi:hypothetical protein